MRSGFVKESLYRCSCWRASAYVGGPNLLTSEDIYHSIAHAHEIGMNGLINGLIQVWATIVGIIGEESEPCDGRRSHAGGDSGNEAFTLPFNRIGAHF